MLAPPLTTFCASYSNDFHDWARDIPLVGCIVTAGCVCNGICSTPLPSARISAEFPFCPNHAVFGIRGVSRCFPRPGCCSCLPPPPHFAPKSAFAIRCFAFRAEVCLPLLPAVSRCVFVSRHFPAISGFSRCSRLSLVCWVCLCIFSDLDSNGCQLKSKRSEMSSTINGSHSGPNTQPGGLVAQHLFAHLAKTYVRNENCARASRQRTVFDLCVDLICYCVCRLDFWLYRSDVYVCDVCVPMPMPI